MEWVGDINNNQRGIEKELEWKSTTEYLSSQNCGNVKFQCLLVDIKVVVLSKSLGSHIIHYEGKSEPPVQSTPRSQ